MRSRSLHPYVRIWVFLISVLSVFTSNFTGLLILYLVLFILIFLSKVIKEHLRLLAVGILPVLISYVLIYVILLNQNNQWERITFSVGKIILLSTALQIVLLIPAKEMVYTLNKYQIKGNLLITILSAYTLIEDIKKRSEKIINARFARGYVKKRTRWNKIKQFPYILTPLLIQVFRSTLERAESWEQKDILTLIQNYKRPIKYDVKFNSFAMTITFVSLLFILFKSNY